MHPTLSLSRFFKLWIQGWRRWIRLDFVGFRWNGNKEIASLVRLGSRQTGLGQVWTMTAMNNFAFYPKHQLASLLAAQLFFVKAFESPALLNFIIAWQCYVFTISMKITGFNPTLIQPSLVGNTMSQSNTEVKQHWARTAFRWESAWELLVLLVLVCKLKLLRGGCSVSCWCPSLVEYVQ